MVISVVDGDTLVAAPTGVKQPEQAALRVRLYGIDAPEMDQPGGREAMAALENLVRPGDFVEITPMDGDRYGRPVGLVLAHGKVVNLELVRQGHVWVYDNYCRADCCKVWRKAMKEAGAERRGLWNEETPVPPWDWRKRKNGRNQ